MSTVYIAGIGAVSPAGWGVPALREALEKNVPLPVQKLARPGSEKPLLARLVPPPPSRLEFLAHPRLRRAGLLSQHVVAAALEALGADAGLARTGARRLGVIVCTLAGGVAYSRRFYEEVLKDPAIASPLIFPETVFNASASHLAAYLNSTGINYTLVGDEGTFLQGLALAATWLAQGQAEACLVVGAEELDWIKAEAVRALSKSTICAGGAGALYLTTQTESRVALAAVTDSFSYAPPQGRAAAARGMQAQLGPGRAGELLCDSGSEGSAWQNWPGPRVTLEPIAGAALNASSAWQCVIACDQIARGRRPGASVSVAGSNQQAIGARFVSQEVTPA